MDQSLDELIAANKQAASAQPPGGGSQACRVFVGNLSWEVDWRSLKDHMSQAGEVVRADVLMGGDGRSKGCGIVEFADSSTAQNAVSTLHDSEILGRKIFVREDKEEENTATKVKVQQPSNNNNNNFNPATAQTRRCYVGNLSWDVAWQDLKDHMRAAGDVVFAEVLEEDGGRSKGCGVVEYSNPEEARKAIAELTNTELNGREIFVREDRETTAAGHRNSTSVYVGNLAFETSWQDLKDCMRAAGNVDKADILTGEDGRSKGCGIVSFQRPNEAARAIREMQNTMLHNRPIFIREDREAGKGQQGGNNGGGCALFVNNLNYQTDWKNLKDHFRAAGEVDRADVVEGKGYGTVVYKRARDAANAIKRLNNTNLDGRPIGVKYDQQADGNNNNNNNGGYNNNNNNNNNNNGGYNNNTNNNNGGGYNNNNNNFNNNNNNNFRNNNNNNNNNNYNNNNNNNNSGYRNNNNNNNNNYNNNNNNNGGGYNNNNNNNNNNFRNNNNGGYRGNRN